MPEKKKLAVYDLIHKRTGTIGVIAHSLNSTFIPSALSGIQQVTAERGYHVLITHSQESIEKELANTRLLFDRRVDGLLACLTDETRDTEHFAPFITNGIPVVFFGRAGQLCGSGRVTIDEARCGYLAAEHLIRQGCRHIVLVTSVLKWAADVRRYIGFRDAMNRWDMGLSGELMIAEDSSADGGADIAGRVLRMDPRPDGLFIPDDAAAVSCMSSLTAAGLRVPEDIAVVGFNNEPIGRMISPALTTIDYPGLEIGRTAASHLLDQLSGRRVARRRVTAIVQPQLIVRRSSLRCQSELVTAQDENKH